MVVVGGRGAMGNGGVWDGDERDGGLQGTRGLCQSLRDPSARP